MMTRFVEAEKVSTLDGLQTHERAPGHVDFAAHSIVLGVDLGAGGSGPTAERAEVE